MFFDLLAPLLIGFLGSLHCLGMCGPLVMAYSLSLRESAAPGGSLPAAPWRIGILHHAAFHLGRVLTYGLLGSLAAGLAHLAGFSRALSVLPGWGALGGGALMIFLGLVLLGIVPAPSFSSGAQGFLARPVASLLSSRGLGSKLALGIAAGFLPCMLSWAMVVKAAADSTPLQGFLTTLAFGLGTVPALFLPGLSASLISLRTRLMGERAAAAAVIIMGGILLFRGASFFA